LLIRNFVDGPPKRTVICLGYKFKKGSTMTKRNVLIVDDDNESVQTIITTLEDANWQYTVVDNNEAAWTAVQEDGAITLVIVRAFGAKISGIDLVLKIRQVKPNTLPIMFMLREHELNCGAAAILAGADDLLVGDFEPRELRMRANITPSDRLNRFDEPHTTRLKDCAATKEAEVFVPEFDPKTKRFDLGMFERRRKDWVADPDVTKLTLDTMIVCPECDGVPTLRPGCSACGSGWTETEVLIHHYACAHVGPESEFLTPSGLVCPKCRLRGLVAGADFEQIKGCLRCRDCAAVSTEPMLICHCINCQNRFPLNDGKVNKIYGYRVGRSPDKAVVAAPIYHRVRSDVGCPTDDVP
jgi:CheY-like chemotaxis protein